MPQDDATFGRAGLPTASGGDGLILKVATWQQRGDTARVTGFIRGTEQSTLADVKALRDQMQGYDLNPDEPVIPVTCEADPSRDGFYSVESVEVSSDVAGRMRSNADEDEIVYRWEADLTRVPGWQAPLFELVSKGAVRDNSPAVVGRSWIGLPPKTALVHSYNKAVSGDFGEIEDTGELFTNLLLWDDASPSPEDTFFDNATVYAVAAANHYAAAAKIEVSHDSGSTFRGVTGRQVRNLPTAFRLSNDLIRLTHSANNVFTFSGRLTGWETKTFMLTSGGASKTSLGTPSSLTVLRNTPERCTIRLWMSAQLSSAAGVYVDFTVNRSSWVLEGVVTTPGTANQVFGIWRDTTEAGASVTGGVDANAVDANGNKYQFRSPLAVTKDTTDGGIYFNAATSFPFAMSFDTLQDSSFTTNLLYFAAMGHQQRIVSR